MTIIPATISPADITTPAAGFRTTTRARRTAPAERRQDPIEPSSPVAPERGGRGRWIAAVGLAAVVGAAGIVALSDLAETPGGPAERASIDARPDAELPGDLVVSGNNVTRTYDARPAATRPDVELPGDLAVSAWSVTRTYDTAPSGQTDANRGPNTGIVLPSPISIEPASPIELSPIVIGEPVAMFGSVSCIPFQHLGPNADLGRDSSGRHMSGREVLEQLRQRGPNADLPFDRNGMRASGNDPICVTG